jgi:broad specificity phosphatase PhoE
MTGIANIFSTPYKRTMQTAQAVAQRSGLPVQAYDPAAPKVLVDREVAERRGPGRSTCEHAA